MPEPTPSNADFAIVLAAIAVCFIVLAVRRGWFRDAAKYLGFGRWIK